MDVKIKWTQKEPWKLIKYIIIWVGSVDTFYWIIN
jgi:hypothetical protein